MNLETALLPGADDSPDGKVTSHGPQRVTGYRRTGRRLLSYQYPVIDFSDSAGRLIRPGRLWRHPFLCAQRILNFTLTVQRKGEISKD